MAFSFFKKHIFLLSRFGLPLLDNVLFYLKARLVVLHNLDFMSAALTLSTRKYTGNAITTGKTGVCRKASSLSDGRDV